MLIAYPGDSFKEEIAVANKGSFTINHLLWERRAIFADLSTTANTQLQTLSNAKVTDDELATALTTRNNNKLDDLWTALKTALNSYTGPNPGNSDITISDEPYPFKLNLLIANKELSTFGSDLDAPIKEQLQTLLNAKVKPVDVKTALDAYQESISSPSAENKSSTQKSTNQNLAIGLGTAGGVVALAGVGGFAYWFVKFRKS